MHAFIWFIRFIAHRATAHRQVGLARCIVAAAVVMASGCATLEQHTGLNASSKTTQLRVGMPYQEVEALLGKPAGAAADGARRIVRWNLHVYMKGWVPYDMVFDAGRNSLISWSQNETEYEKSVQRMTTIINDFTNPPGPNPVPDGRGGGLGVDATGLPGKWCYMKNVYSSSGGSQSNLCYTLYANGTYQYTGEGSSSNPYGSTASQSSDRGTWSVSAGRLEIQSARHGRQSYRLEKRNHPKNKNDPMLVLDGEAWVTAGPKAPW